jgi:glycine cleavage system H lipoate-binding protein
MTVLLVLATFIVFLTIDYFLSRKRAAVTVAGLAPERAPQLRPAYVAGFALPEGLRYHPGHTWAAAEGPEKVRMGMDDFAARLVGKIEKIELPKRGQWVRQGQKLATITRDGATADIVAPVEGMVTEVNDALAADPALALRDPYGEGWLVAVQSPDAKINFRNLLGGNVARRWMQEAVERLAVRMPALAGAVAQDGGIAVDDLTAHLPDEDWAELTREFLLS